MLYVLCGSLLLRWCAVWHCGFSSFFFFFLHFRKPKQEEGASYKGAKWLDFSKSSPLLHCMFPQSTAVVRELIFRLTGVYCRNTAHEARRFKNPHACNRLHVQEYVFHSIQWLHSATLEGWCLQTETGCGLSRQTWIVVAESRLTADLDCGSAWGSPDWFSRVVQAEEVKRPPVRDRKRRCDVKLLCPAQQHMCWVSQKRWLTTRGLSQGQDSWKVTASFLAIQTAPQQVTLSPSELTWGYYRALTTPEGLDRVWQAVCFLAVILIRCMSSFFYSINVINWTLTGAGSPSYHCPSFTASDCPVKYRQFKPKAHWGRGCDMNQGAVAEQIESHTKANREKKSFKSVSGLQLSKVFCVKWIV